MSPGNRRNITVFDRHGFSCRLQFVLLIGPDVGDRYVKSQNTALQCLDQAREPQLQCDALLAALTAYPKCELRNDDRTGVAVFLFPIELRHNICVAFFLAGWLRTSASSSQLTT